MASLDWRDSLTLKLKESLIWAMVLDCGLHLLAEFS
jgi:hypothetical protein